MPEPVRLILEHLRQFRVGVAQRVHRDPCAQIEKASTVRLIKPGAFAFDEGQRSPVIGRQNGRNHRLVPLEKRGLMGGESQRACQRLGDVF
jgi:hypothetical protein